MNEPRSELSEDQRLQYEIYCQLRRETMQRSSLPDKKYIQSIITSLVLVYNITGFLAIILIALSIYVLASSWGGLDPTFFIDIGICSLLFSTCVLLFAIIGWATISRHYKRYTPPPLSPHTLASIFSRGHLLVIFQFLLIAALVVETYVLAHAFDALLILKTAKKSLSLQTRNTTSLDLPPVAAFSELEHNLARRFNSFFFGAAASCTNANFSWWWDWLAIHCQPDLHLNSCTTCEEYTVTYCAADVASCYDSISPSGMPQTPGDGASCPYTLCRQNITLYMLEQIYPFVYCVLAVMGVQGIVFGGNVVVLIVMRGVKVGFGLGLVESGAVRAIEGTGMGGMGSAGGRRSSGGSIAVSGGAGVEMAELGLGLGGETGLGPHTLPPTTINSPTPTTSTTILPTLALDTLNAIGVGVGVGILRSIPVLGRVAISGSHEVEIQEGAVLPPLEETLHVHAGDMSDNDEVDSEGNEDAGGGSWVNIDDQESS